jgi:putative endonuclease
VPHDPDCPPTAVPAKAGTHLPACAMFFAYLRASKPQGTLYIGSTSDVVRRVWEHKVKAIPGFTARGSVDRLVWFERHDTLETAMQREKRVKSWKRAWKIELIEKDNPHWIDLYPSLS